MSDIPPQPAIATARRNAAQRVERLLVLLERDGRAPGARQRCHLLEALERLAAGQFPQAEEAMLKAERSRSVVAAVRRDGMSIGDMRAQLDSILQRTD
jgi:hypothetical protein